MNFGEIVYQLESADNGYLPQIHGRFMHAAFFAALRDMSEEVASFVHNEMNIKPFTVSMLHFINKAKNNRETDIKVNKGDRAVWRVTVFSEQLLQAILNLPQNHIFQVGRLHFSINAAKVTVTSEKELLTACLAKSSKLKNIAFEFVSPVSFRLFKDDYPLPAPEYIWGSLADKWQQMDMELSIDKQQVKEIAAKLIPVSWSGHSERIFFGRERGVNCFSGSFRYSLKNLTSEEKAAIVTLAFFGRYSGVGRLTAQGLGQTYIGGGSE